MTLQQSRLSEKNKQKIYIEQNGYFVKLAVIVSSFIFIGLGENFAKGVIHLLLAVD
jgi:hypothetical protein